MTFAGFLWIPVLAGSVMATFACAIAEASALRERDGSLADARRVTRVVALLGAAVTVAVAIFA